MNNTSTLSFDTQGRPTYHPDYHEKHNSAWTTAEERYLIDNYSAVGLEQMSLELGRTVNSISSKVGKLREAGRMGKASMYHKRLLKPSSI